MKRFLYYLVMAIVTALIISVTGCAKQYPVETAGAADVERGYRVLIRGSMSIASMEVWTDPETKCQYLRIGTGSPIPRLNESGHPMCSN